MIFDFSAQGKKSKHIESTKSSRITKAVAGDMVVTDWTKNLFDGDINKTTTTPNYRFYKLPSGTKTVSITKKESGSAITTDIDLGICMDSSRVSSGFVWLTDNDTIKFPTKTTDYEYLFIYPYTSSAFQSVLNRFNIMVEMGTVATEYVPYEYDINSIILRSAGSISDTIETKTYNNFKSVDLGTLTWKASSSTVGAYYATLSDYNFSNDVVAICDKYDYIGTITGTSRLANYDKIVSLFYSANASEREVSIRDTSYASASDLKSALNGTILHYEASEGGSDYKATVYHKRVGEVDLATVGFTYSSTYSRWQCSAISGMKKPSSNDVAFVGIAENYNVNSANAGSSGDICANTSGDMRLYIDSTQTPTGKLYYELATECIYDITDLSPDETTTPFEAEYSTVTVNSAMSAPVLGLKSYEHITGIIAPANVEIIYPKDSEGAAILSAPTEIVDGKILISSAITDNGVETSASDSFEVMATNIDTLADYIKPALLWTNSQPLATFAATTIAEDLSNYNYIIVEMENYYTGRVKSTFLIAKGETKMCVCSQSDDSIGSGVAYRKIKVLDNGIQFYAGGEYTGSGTTDNRCAMPLKIWGCTFNLPE